jgi:hypothetical protein
MIFAETISATGWVIPPVVIIKGVHLLECHFKDLLDGYLATTSESSYSTRSQVSAHIRYPSVSTKKTYIYLPLKLLTYVLY